jgi:mono/diheme cytochrome c family protein
MLRRVLKVLGTFFVLVMVAFAGVYAYARGVVRGHHEMAAPDIRAASSPVAIAHGEVLVRTACVGCHADPVSGRLSGSKLDFPSFMGDFYASNITSDPAAGIGGVSDALVARAIRAGIKRDGTLAAMPRFPELSDDDVAAILGFLRSASPDLAPSNVVQPPTQYRLAGTMIVAFLFPAYPDAARLGVTGLAKAPTAEYGRYLANSAFDCFECHTEGFGRGKLQKPGLYGGRVFPGEDPSGRQIYAPNLTPDATGLGDWSLEEFTQALKTGIARDGRVLQPPMMRLRLLDDTEFAALWAYLRSLPPVVRASPVARAQKKSAEAPADLFVSLGCAGCHAAGQRFADRLSGCVGKPVADVARWIRNPQQIKPDTQMPTYEAVVDEATAASLAKWVQEMAARGPIAMGTRN